MDAKVLSGENQQKDRVSGTENGSSIEVKVPPKVNKYIPDYIQQTIMDELDRINDEIYRHEKAIKDLESLYTAPVRYLETYSPFSSGNLSQNELLIKQSPEALPQEEGGGKNEQSIRDSTQ